jgi:LacI family transcriptional regulator
VDGFVLLRVLLDDDRVRYLLRQRFPFVTYGRLPGIGGFPAVDEGDEAVWPAVEHLVSLGHRRIGCLAEPQRQAKAAARLQSFLTAMHAHGLTVEPRHIVESGYREDTGYEAALGLLSVPEPPTAIVALNDLLAIGALRAAKELSIDVPGALSIVGFDDIDASRRVSPGLTTLRQPTLEIGRLLIRQLLTAVERSESASVRLVEPTLVVRGTTGPPR